MKLIIAGLIGAGVIGGAGAVYVFVIAPPAVQHAIVPAVSEVSGGNAQQRAQEVAGCQAAEQDLGSAHLSPMCKQILAGKIGD
ncbi:MAG: hypothetical protein PHE83_16210 [Opitutaceae bacterium]|nr:hypothetical protein [Opitutaceae bacterium]